MNAQILETIIYGRVEPHIYAFQTTKVPHYTKVGDTYRPTEVRKNEWKRIIGAELETIFDEPALVDETGEVYFRDYSVHKFLEDQLKKHRLTKQDPEGTPWYSNEFFKETDENDVRLAVKDVAASYTNGNSRGYEYYETKDKSHKEIVERKEKNYPLRDNQKDVVDRFKARYFSKDKKLNLLMYAVMRFGKSFTALQCALAMEAKLVIVVSGKNDVWKSWRDTLYEHQAFDSYEFITVKHLKQKNFNLKSEIDSGKKYVLYLSLQDLQGKKVKENHKQLFKLKEPQTLLVVDETHFGARASEYGQVLKSAGDKEQIAKDKSDDTETSDQLEAIKNFDHIRVRIHLSGTPYRILMNGEFADKDIISFVQYGDIVKAQKQWDDEHFEQEGEEYQEWKNPYFGFPEMIRFAFNPNEESMALIQEMRKNGAGGLSELFAPVSVEKSANPRFRHEDLVIGLLRSIDGSKKDKNIFPFLTYPKIQEGKMCQHIVMVLPFQSSCDAMEVILKSGALTKLHAYSDITNEGYEIINISGFNCPRELSKPDFVVNKIHEYASEGKKTITLTVQRMLTGSTVPEWDTMIFLKDTSSPQEYDQATFRIQNPYFKENVCKGEGEEKTIRVNMKPQTLLVDFDPARMFRIEELKSGYYNGDDANGNNDRKERIKENLDISPIIMIANDNLVRVEPSSVIEAVRDYSKTRSVIDEAGLIPSDDALLDDKNIRLVIGALSAFNEKKGLEFNPFTSDNTSDVDLKELLKSLKDKQKSTNNNKGKEEESEEEQLRKKLKTFYASILMFAFLSESKIQYLDDIIKALGPDGNCDDKRIADNIGLNVHILEIVRDKASQNARHQLDNRIENIHDLMQKTEGKAIDKAMIALTKFDRLSAAEIVTPVKIQDVVIEGLSDFNIQNDSIFLDVASKQGELTIAFLKKFPGFNKNNIFSVATSSIAYEMTRKVYAALGINTDNVILPPVGGKEYYKDLLTEIKKNLGDKQPNIVLCCPPFQKPKGGGRGDGGSDIYPSYYDLCKRLNPNDGNDDAIPYMFGMFTKATWNTLGTTYVVGESADCDEEDDENYEFGDIKIPDFRKMILNDNHVSAINDYLSAAPFYNRKVTLRGGVNIMFWNATTTDNVRINLYDDKHVLKSSEERSLLPDNLRQLMIDNGIVCPTNPDFPYVRIGGLGLNILEKVLTKTKEEQIPFVRVKPRNVFKITENIEKKFTGKPEAEGGVKTYLRNGNWLVIDKSIVKGYGTNEKLVKERYKVVAAKGSSGEDNYPHAIISQPRIVEKGAVCSDTYLVIKDFETPEEAEAFVGYMKSQFFRFMMLLAKSDQNLTRHCYRFVPDIPASQYDNIKDYFDFEDDEISFIESFIKKWDSQDTPGKSLNLS